MSAEKLYNSSFLVAWRESVSEVTVSRFACSQLPEKQLHNNSYLEELVLLVPPDIDVESDTSATGHATRSGQQI